MPWLVWLSGLNAGLQTKGSLVRFPVRGHVWVVGLVPSMGLCEGQPHLVDHLPLVHALTGDRTHNPGVCLDWELNP